MKKIAFVISHIPDPRINKRITIAKQVGEVSLIYWNRQVIDIWNLQHKDINNIEIIEKANYGYPLKRLCATFKVFIKVYKYLKKIKPQTIYVGNLDMLCMVVFYKRRSGSDINIIYEIADLPKLIGNGTRKVVGRILLATMMRVEKICYQEIDTLVVTSEKFYDVYYKKFIEKGKLLFVPNMPNREFFKNYKRKTEGDFVIGFIGAVRYKKQMKMLITAAKETDISVFFAGSILEEEIGEECGDKIKFYGKYDYNTEIAKMYSMVDCVYAVYDATLFNVRVALPNKLYESIYCGIPIIVAKNTYLSELVNKWGVGVAVDCQNVSELIVALSCLKDKGLFYNNLVNNCNKRKEYINDQLYSDKLRKCFEI